MNFATISWVIVRCRHVVIIDINISGNVEILISGLNREKEKDFIHRLRQIYRSLRNSADEIKSVGDICENYCQRFSSVRSFPDLLFQHFSNRCPLLPIILLRWLSCTCDSWLLGSLLATFFKNLLYVLILPLQKTISVKALPTSIFHDYL